MIFFVIKHNNINKKYHKFPWKPQLTHHVCSFAWMMSLMLRHSLLVQNFGTFLSSWKMAKNTIKGSRFFFHKINKKYAKKTRDEMFLQSRFEVTDVKFKNFSLHNFVKTGQISAKLCIWLFLHKINKNLSWKQGSNFDLRSPLRILEEHFSLKFSTNISTPSLNEKLNVLIKTNVYQKI